MVETRFLVGGGGQRGKSHPAPLSPQSPVPSHRYQGMSRTAIISSALLAIAGLSVGVDDALAQSQKQSCQPPEAGEYLLLVVTQSRPSQRLLRQSLPDKAKLTVCQYIDNVVTRIGGFRSLSDAQKWVRYVTDIAGLPAFVVEPSVDAALVANKPSPPSPPSPTSIREEEQKPKPTSENVPAFNPQLLGRGYAVLVEYSNQPEVATQLQQILGKKVGLVSFGQRPYLLAMYTTNERNASNTFRLLSDRGFLVMLVDGNKVTLLKPQVQNPQ